MNVKNDYAKWTKMGGGETSLLNRSPADDAHTSTHTPQNSRIKDNRCRLIPYPYLKVSSKIITAL